MSTSFLLLSSVAFFAEILTNSRFFSSESSRLSNAQAIRSALSDMDAKERAMLAAYMRSIDLTPSCTKNSQI